MTHVFNILLIACVNRFLRLVLKKEPPPESLAKEMSNYAYTVIGVAVVYMAITLLLYIISAFLF
jgi:hypothetical protein